MYNHKY